MNCHEGYIVSALQETITTTIIIIIIIINHRQKLTKWRMGKGGERSHQSYLKRPLEFRSSPKNNTLRSIRPHCLRLLNLVHIIQHLRRECARS